MISFDIYDTLITRATATPKGVFVAMQERMKQDDKYRKKLSSYFLNHFYEIRCEAERYARQQEKENGRQEITLDLIYQMIEMHTGIGQELLLEIKELEYETEEKLTIPFTENIDRLKAYLLKEKVVLISDMYLSEDFIRRLLIKQDPVFEKMAIYISSELNKTKSSGMLYSYVKEKEKCGTELWVHIGDNPFSDGVMAEKMRIRTEIFHSELTASEKGVLREEDYSSQRIIGSIRMTRLCNGKKGIPYTIGASVGINILLPYVLWVIKTCLSSEINHLYFVARDGWILYQIAKEIVTFYQYDLKLHYIYASRIVWRLSDHLPEEEPNKEALLSSENARLVRDYMLQETNALEDGRIALVDVQGTGLSEVWLAEILPEYQILTFFYRKSGFLQHDKVEYFVYYIAENAVGNVIETLTRALHGRTVGYCRKEEKIIPIMEDDENVLLEEYGLQDYFAGIMENVKCFLDVHKEEPDLEYDQISQDYFEYISEHPEQEILGYIADMPFSDTIDGREVLRPFAPRLGKKYFKYRYLYRENMQDIKWGNTEYSLLRCSEQDIRCIERYKRISNTLFGKMLRWVHYRMKR